MQVTARRSEGHLLGYRALDEELQIDRLAVEGEVPAWLAGSLLRIVPVRLLMLDQFHSDQRIKRVNVPLLIMHGSSDPTIPIGFGERLFALAHEPKQFVRFPGGGHDNLDGFGAIETARQFINAAKG